MKVIYVKSCENCPNVRKMVISVYCMLNGSQNQLPLDYSIPEWCPLDNYVESKDNRKEPETVDTCPFCYDDFDARQELDGDGVCPVCGWSED